MAEFVLQIHDIDVGGKDYSFALSRPWMQTALEGCELQPAPEAADGTLDVHAQKTGADVFVRAHLRAELAAPCSRCLADAFLDVDTTVNMLFTARGANFRPEPDEQELTPEDLDREFFTGDRIVLDDLVREHLLLELPMQVSCGDACPGFALPEKVRPPADFGAAEGAAGVDPRLAPLMKLSLEGKHKKE